VRNDETALKKILEFLQAPSRVLWAYFFYHASRKSWARSWLCRNIKYYASIKGLHSAAALGLDNALEGLLHLGHNINALDHRGQRALFHAVNHNCKSVLQCLLSKSELDVNVEDLEGQTSLSNALGDGKEDLATLILGHPKLIPDSKDDQGLTPLMWAIIRHNEKAVQLILARPNVKVNSKAVDGFTAMAHAIWPGSLGVVEQLLKKPNVDLVSRYKVRNYSPTNLNNRTLLHLAFSRPGYLYDEMEIGGRTSIIRLLLATKAIGVNERESRGATMLHLSTAKRSTRILETLLEQDDIDLNAKDTDGQTPLHWADVLYKP
jgi:ankyrin repeat protein